MNRRKFFRTLGLGAAGAALAPLAAKETGAINNDEYDIFYGTIYEGHVWTQCQAPSTVNDSARAEMAQMAKWRRHR